MACSICLEPFDFEASIDLVALPCSHVFHGRCVAEHYERGGCPNCRHKSPNGVASFLALKFDVDAESRRFSAAARIKDRLLTDLVDELDSLKAPNADLVANIAETTAKAGPSQSGDGIKNADLPQATLVGDLDSVSKDNPLAVLLDELESIKSSNVRVVAGISDAKSGVARELINEVASLKTKIAILAAENAELKDHFSSDNEPQFIPPTPATPRDSMDYILPMIQPQRAAVGATQRFQTVEQRQDNGADAFFFGGPVGKASIQTQPRAAAPKMVNLLFDDDDDDLESLLDRNTQPVGSANHRAGVYFWPRKGVPVNEHEKTKQQRPTRAKQPDTVAAMEAEPQTLITRAASFKRKNDKASSHANDEMFAKLPDAKVRRTTTRRAALAHPRMEPFAKQPKNAVAMKDKPQSSKAVAAPIRRQYASGSSLTNDEKFARQLQELFDDEVLITDSESEEDLSMDFFSHVSKKTKATGGQRPVREGGNVQAIGEAASTSDGAAAASTGLLQQTAKAVDGPTAPSTSTTEPGKTTLFTACSICLEPFDLEASIDIVALPCSHVFHGRCVSEHYDRGGCPKCRRKSPGGVASFLALKFDVDEERKGCSAAAKIRDRFLTDLVDELDSVKATNVDLVANIAETTAKAGPSQSGSGIKNAGLPQATVVGDLDSVSKDNPLAVLLDELDSIKSSNVRVVAGISDAKSGVARELIKGAASLKARIAILAAENAALKDRFSSDEEYAKRLQAEFDTEADARMARQLAASYDDEDGPNGVFDVDNKRQKRTTAGQRAGRGRLSATVRSVNVTSKPRSQKAAAHEDRELRGVEESEQDDEPDAYFFGAASKASQAKRRKLNDSSQSPSGGSASVSAAPSSGRRSLADNSGRASIFSDFHSVGDDEVSREPHSYDAKRQLRVDINILEELEAEESTEDEEKVALPVTFFEGQKFVLTSANRRIRLNAELESDERPPIPFYKKQVRQMIEEAGGTVAEDFTTYSDTKNCFLVADTHYRTHKYLSALARAVSCVSHMWIYNQRQEGRKLSPKNYLLLAGVSLEKSTSVEWHDKCPSLLQRLTVLVYTTNKPEIPSALDFVQIWSPLAACMGADVITDLPTDGTKVDILLTDNSCAPDVLKAVEESGGHAVSSEWLVQAIITGELPKPDAHQKYKYDFVETAVAAE